MSSTETGYPGLNYKIVHVGIGEYKVDRSPTRIHTVLGSCVGVIIYEPDKKIGGLAHIYLPNSSDYKNSTSLGITGERCNFADLLIPRMIDDLLAMEACYAKLLAYLTGGAYMLKVSYSPDFDIGKKNLAAAREILKSRNIHARELSIGGPTGQSVYFNLFDGGIDVKIHTPM